MKRFTFLLSFLLLSGLLSAQLSSRWVMAVSGFANVVTVNDSTYTADLSFQGDQTGNGYLGTGVQVGFRVLTSTKRQYRVTVVNSSALSSANLTLVQLPGTTAGPSGAGLAYADDGELIPLLPVNSTGISSALAAVIQTHNVQVTPAAGGGPALTLNEKSTYHISSTFGSDSTGTYERRDLPFKTLAGAPYTLSDDVILLDGVHVFNQKANPENLNAEHRATIDLSATSGQNGILMDSSAFRVRSVGVVSGNNVGATANGVKVTNTGTLDFYANRFTAINPAIGTGQANGVFSLGGGAYNIKIDSLAFSGHNHFIWIADEITPYTDALDNSVYNIEIENLDFDFSPLEIANRPLWLYGARQANTDTINNLTFNYNVKSAKIDRSAVTPGASQTFVHAIGEPTRARFKKSYLRFNIDSWVEEIPNDTVPDLTSTMTGGTEGIINGSNALRSLFMLRAALVLDSRVDIGLGSILDPGLPYLYLHDVVVDNSVVDINVGKAVFLGIGMEFESQAIRNYGTVNVKVGEIRSLQRGNVVAIKTPLTNNSVLRFEGRYIGVDTTFAAFAITGSADSTSKFIFKDVEIFSSAPYSIDASVPTDIYIEGSFKANKPVGPNVTLIYEENPRYVETYIVSKAATATREDSVAIDSTMFLTLPAGTYELQIDLQAAASTTTNFAAGLVADYPGNWRLEGSTVAAGWETLANGTGLDGGDPLVPDTPFFLVMRGTVDLATETTLYLEWGMANTTAVGFARLYPGTFIKAVKIE